MIEYRRYLDNYQFYPTSKDITNWKEVDEHKLQLAIDIFQDELNWDKMWSVEDAKQRLEDGWLFSVIEIKNRIQGWFWLNYETKEGSNLYVQKDSRNQGYGFGLISYIITAAKLRQLDYVWSQIDEWNEISKRLFTRCGYEVHI
jgi:GNAT superfamily N-acetyltransferase